MLPGLLVQLHPSTPWRIGSESGTADSVESLYRSDQLYSAVTLAMEQLGHLEEWIAATAASAEPAVRFSCAYPFLHSTLFVVPPKSLWPPPPTPRVRWKAARYVPVPLVETLLHDPDARLREEEGWTVDAQSQCLLPGGSGTRQYGPFRIGMRRTVPVDRWTGVSGEARATACLEFAPGGGLWFLAAFADDGVAGHWSERLRAAIRLLADTGFGAGRSRGWGRAEAPEFRSGRFPSLLLKAPAIPEPAVAEPPASEDGDGSPESLVPSAPLPVAEAAYWLLSLFSPGEGDAVDWTRGSYAALERSGRTGSAGGAPTRAVRMIAEGSVLLAARPLRGAAPDVAPEGAPHRVYRSGFALAIPIVWRVPA